jgi:hypothetical protein
MEDDFLEFVSTISGTPDLRPWIERVKEADRHAEQCFRDVILTEADDQRFIQSLALISIAAELRAQRIARDRRWGAGQPWGPSHPSYEEMGQ